MRRIAVSGPARVGDAVRGGIVLDAKQPTRVQIHGNYIKGFWVRMTGTDIEMGPYPTPTDADLVARRWDGILERNA